MQQNKRKILTVVTVMLLALPNMAWAAKATKPAKAASSTKITKTVKKSVLSVGDKGWKVKTVQIKLNVIGMRTPTSGRFTKDLETQVKNFQHKYKLKITGKVDDNTYHKLLSAAFEKEGIRGIKGSDVVKTASKYKGVPYGFGGTTPRAFDCSGYVQYVFKKHKAILPRTADLQYEKGLFVTQRQLQPGDLVFFSTYEPGASHVGIYAGSGKFWNATSSRGVMLCGLSDDYWRQRYYGAKRVLAGTNK